MPILIDLKYMFPPKLKPARRKKPQKININLADAWLFEALPGIGQTKAQAIVEYRNKHGSFRRIEDLLNVTGISKSILDTIKPLITVED